MLHLVLVFSGAIGFVPMTENGQPVLYALFAEGREPAVASDKSILPSHFPVLRVKRDNVVPSNLPDDSIYMTTGDEGAEGGEDLVWFFDQEQLELELPAQGSNPPARLPSLTFSGSGEQPAASRPVPCLEKEEVSLDWLPQMAELSPTGGEVNAGCLADKPTPGLLSARMKVSSGKVSATAFGLTKVPLFDFGTLTSPTPVTKFSRAVPGAVQVILEIPGCKAILRARSLGDKKETGAITITAPGCDQIPDPLPVEVNLMNIPIEDAISQRRLFLKEPPHEHETVDKHFEMFYDLLKTPPPANARPVPKLVDSRTVGDEALISMCSDRSKPAARGTIDILKALESQSHERSGAASIKKDESIEAFSAVRKLTLMHFIRTKEFRCPGTKYLPPSGKP